LLGELAVLGKKAVARMDGVDVRNFCGANDPISPHIAINAFWAAYANGLVGELDMQ
jgi:hypothetical protein